MNDKIKNYEEKINFEINENKKLKEEINKMNITINNLQLFIKQNQIDKEEYQKNIMEISILKNQNKQFNDKINYIIIENQKHVDELLIELNSIKLSKEQINKNSANEIDELNSQIILLKNQLNEQQQKTSLYLKEISELQRKYRDLENEYREKIIQKTSNTNVSFYKERVILI